eukprot:1304387-Rhodomonas_salina.1
MRRCGNVEEEDLCPVNIEPIRFQYEAFWRDDCAIANRSGVVGLVGRLAECGAQNFSHLMNAADRMCSLQVGVVVFLYEVPRDSALVYETITAALNWSGEGPPELVLPPMKLRVGDKIGVAGRSCKRQKRSPIQAVKRREVDAN